MNINRPISGSSYSVGKDYDGPPTDSSVNEVIERLSFTYMANGKRQIQVENFSKQKISG